MKSFLLNNKTNTPVCKWSQIPQGTHFEGNIPTGFSRAISPSPGIVIIDFDVKNNKNAFDHVPNDILEELNKTFNYFTSSGNGKHFWIKYLGTKQLMNRATKHGIDLRVSEKGYVKYHHNVDIRECEHLIKESSNELNLFLEKLFSND